MLNLELRFKRYEYFKRTPISATRVGVRESAHTFCVVYKRNSPHTYVWAKQVMPTHLFFPSRSLSHACVWAKLITPTRPYVRPRTSWSRTPRVTVTARPQLPWSRPSSMFV